MSLCFLLAAGEGRRLRPYTSQCVKPRLHFLNLPLAYYGIFLASKAGYQNFLMNKHHLPEQVDQMAHDLNGHVPSIKTVDETEKLLGSGGALWNARTILQEYDQFLIANGDEVLLTEDDQVLKKLEQRFKETKPLSCLLTCDHPELLKSLKAVWVNDKGEVRGFGMEAPEPGLRPVHYTGYKIFSKKILSWLPEAESNIFYDVLVSAIQKGEKVQSFHIPGAIWHETGNFDSFLKASQAVCSDGWQGVQDRLTHFGKARNEKLQTEKALIVHPKGFRAFSESQCRGMVVLNHQEVPPNCSFENAIIQPGGLLKENQTYKNEMVL